MRNRKAKGKNRDRQTETERERDEEQRWRRIARFALNVDFNDLLFPPRVPPFARNNHEANRQADKLANDRRTIGKRLGLRARARARACFERQEEREREKESEVRCRDTTSRDDVVVFQ